MCNNQTEASHIVDEGISVVAIKDLKGCNFFVPSYQRGYRWTRQQVEELINDIFELLDKDNGQDSKYCLQPLVVKKTNDDNGNLSWEVIDGQQRLTTIYIILKYLVEDSYTLSYETRKKSKDFLSTIDKAQYTQSIENIDFYHMYQAYLTVQRLFTESHYSERKDSFKKFLLDKVTFIWYAINVKQNPIEVFTRLNIDKISLTPSELIKALLLNKSNFSSQYGADKIHMRQQEIASEWDAIENQLQDDSFWLFFNDVGYRSSTRIDYLFEILCDQNMLHKVNKDKIGNDDARTFRYIYEYFKCKDDSQKCEDDSQTNTDVQTVTKSQKMNYVWSQVKSIFDTLNEWYNDLELYHYIGYILSRPKESTRTAGNPIEMKNKLHELWTEWQKKGMTVSKFKDYLHDQIQTLIDGCNDVSKEYDGSSKTACRPILLLHNVLTVILQGQVAQKEYAQDITVKFPFNLYKMEKWDVEHIDSNTTNDLQDFDQQKEWLLTNYIVVKDIPKDENNQEESLTTRIENFCERKLEDMEDDSKRNIYFNELCNEIKGYISDDDNLCENKNGRNEKNLLWNFTLLDEKTNRGYGNSIFPAKRRIIIGKEQGKYYPCPTCNAQKGFNNPDPVPATSSFILPCTKQAFLKYYSPMSGTMTVWTHYDAEAYLKNIIEVIMKKFNFKVKKDGQDI